MKHSRSTHVDLDGNVWDLNDLDVDERRLFAEIRKQARRYETADGDALKRWCDFDNSWMPKVQAFYVARGVKPKRTTYAPVFQLAHDVSGRLSLALGLTREADYRDYLLEIIADQFRSRRAFCKATGISEDMLSHVLAGRKDLSVEALTKALARIGYTIRFEPRASTSKSA